MPAPSKRSAAKVQMVRELHAQGRSSREIAAAVGGISHVSVASWLKAMNLKPNGAPGPRPHAWPDGATVPRASTGPAPSTSTSTSTPTPRPAPAPRTLSPEQEAERARLTAELRDLFARAAATRELQARVDRELRDLAQKLGLLGASPSP